MIIKVLYDIGKMISFIIDLIVDFVSDIIQVIKIVFDAFSYLPEFLSWLPGTVLTIVSALFTVVLLYKILGREG